MDHYKGFLPVFFFLIVIVVGYFFAYPQWQERATNTAANESAKLENDQLKESQAQMDSFVRQYQGLRSEQSLADKALPVSEVEMHNILNNLGNFAATSGVSILDIAVSDPTSDPTAANSISYVDLDMSVAGTYPSFRAFLLQMETSLRLMDIHSIELTTEETANTIIYQMTTRVYYQK